jgi:hypothetical protein
LRLCASPLRFAQMCSIVIAAICAIPAAMVFRFRARLREGCLRLLRRLRRPDQWRARGGGISALEMELRRRRRAAGLQPAGACALAPERRGGVLRSGIEPAIEPARREGAVDHSEEGLRKRLRDLRRDPHAPRRLPLLGVCRCATVRTINDPVKASVACGCCARSARGPPRLGVSPIA